MMFREVIKKTNVKFQGVKHNVTNFVWIKFCFAHNFYMQSDKLKLSLDFFKKDVLNPPSGLEFFLE